MGETSEKRPRAKAGDEDGRGGEVKNNGGKGKMGGVIWEEGEDVSKGWSQVK